MPAQSHSAGEQRSRLMSRVRSKNTKPELLIRSLLHRNGLRFRLHRVDLPGKPDIVLPKYQVAIFIDGCFWHQHPGCRKAVLPKTNMEFWSKKLAANVVRDSSSSNRLMLLGWGVIRVWECAIKKDAEAVIGFICSKLEENSEGRDLYIVDLGD